MRKVQGLAGRHVAGAAGWCWQCQREPHINVEENIFFVQDLRDPLCSLSPVTSNLGTNRGLTQGHPLVGWLA
jgi:hypothetical protein